MQVICIDDNFEQESIIRIPNRPIQGKLYNIRDFFNTRNGKAVHLHEIVNPHLDAGNGMTFEPSFSAKRFTNLLGEQITSISKSKIEQL